MYTDTDIYTHMHTFTSLKEFNPWQMRRLGSTRKSWDRAGLRTARWSCRSSEQRQSRLFGDAGRPTVERRHRTFASLQIAVSFSECSSEIRPKSTPQLYRTPAWFLKLELGCLSLRSTVGAVSLPIFMFTEIQRCNFNRQKAVWMLSISFHKSFHKSFHIFPQVFPYLSIMNDLPALTALILAGATSLWGRELLNGAEPKTTAA